MGIKGLYKEIVVHAPDSIKENSFNSYFGRKIALDASMAIQQFLRAIRNSEDGSTLTGKDGFDSSHVVGFFYRTTRMILAGIIPIWVFDGKASDMKNDELKKRKAQREIAVKKLEEAKEVDDKEMIRKYSKRIVRPTERHLEEVKTLLDLMGVPYIQAEGEADIECARLTLSGDVYAVGTEDMDALPFGSVRQLRYILASESKKLPVVEITLEKVLEGYGFTMSQFVDYCILLGCDYLPTIRNLGKKTAYKMIKEHGSIEKIIENLSEKYVVPEHFDYEKAREIFSRPERTKHIKLEKKLRIRKPKREKLIEFLCQERNMNQERVERMIEKLEKNRKKPKQTRITSFFAPRAKKKRSEKQ